MYDKGIFVFGSKIFDIVPRQDAITTLPLELSWKIFSYVDDSSLRVAYHLQASWARIISANKKLRNRLNFFDLTLKLGSKSLTRFHRRNARKMKKENRRNFLATCQNNDHSLQTTTIKLKRGGSDLIIYTKRFKLF